MAFWAAEVVPGKEYNALPHYDLHLTQVVLPANAGDNGRSVLQAKVDDKQFTVASLKLNLQENISLDLIFEAGKPITFTVSGKNPVQLLGYYIDNQGGGLSDDDDLDGDSFDFDEEVDSEGEEDEPAGGEGEDDEDEDEDEDDDENEDIEAAIQQASLKQLQQKRKAQLESERENGAKKPKVDQQQKPQQQQPKGGQQPQQKGGQQQQQKGQQQPKGEQQPKGGQQQKGQQGQQQQRPQTPGKEQQQQKPQTPGNKEQPQQKGGQTPQQKEVNEGKTKFVNGVKIETTTIGLGNQVQVGKKAYVMYTGRLTSGKVFDKSNSPFGFRLGAGEVIKGWDIGVHGMRVGEKRKLTIPPQLAYGSSGAPPDIPPNSTLVFDVELVRI